MNIKRLIILITSLIIIVTIMVTYSNNEVNTSFSTKDFTLYLDKRIPNLMNHYDVPGVNIALVNNGKISWSKAYGYADLKEKRKMTLDTICRVESISKSVTTWGIMKLVEQGKIELDKPIIQYINSWEFPKSNFSNEGITIRQLLSNSAGMPLGTIGVHYSPKEKTPSLKELLTNDAILQQNPGISFSYSNTGFNLLELLIEEITEQKFADYMKNEILIPLKMYNSSFTWSEDFNPKVPNGYDLKGNPVPVYIYPDKASGGLFATVEDIANFVRAGMINSNEINKNVLNEKSINEIYTPTIKISGFYSLAFDNYGLGHFIENLSDGKKAVSHGGQGSGWMTHFHSIPDTGDAIIILTNSQRSWPFFANILNDWSKWRGYSSLGMSKIIRGQQFIWLFIIVISFISLWLLWRLVKDINNNKRQFKLLTKNSLYLRLIQFSISIILITILLWAINQDYLFISSIFPMVSNWLGISIFIFACVLFLLTLFPYKQE